MSQENPSSMVPMLLTFIAGAAVGGIVAALTTPKSGPELRGNLKDLGRRAKREAGNLADAAGTAWDGVRERTALASSDLSRGLTDAADHLRG